MSKFAAERGKPPPLRQRLPQPSGPLDCFLFGGSCIGPGSTKSTKNTQQLWPLLAATVYGPLDLVPKVPENFDQEPCKSNGGVASFCAETNHRHFIASLRSLGYNRLRLPKHACKVLMGNCLLDHGRMFAAVPGASLQVHSCTKPTAIDGDTMFLNCGRKALDASMEPLLVAGNVKAQ